MAIREVVTFPHPALVEKARPVEVFDAELHRLIDDMAETMYASHGVGLAANQISELRRVIVMDCAGQEEPPQLLELVNPEIVDRTGEVVWNEGCLSFPELFEQVRRSATVTMRFRDRTGAERSISADGLLAVCIQHEIDHLDGIVFTDRMSPIVRRLAMRRYRRSLAPKAPPRGG